MSPARWLAPRPGPATFGSARGPRLDELVLPPNLVSLLRIPLAALFPLVSGRPAAALAVLALAGATDVADGRIARRLGQVTTTGAIVDPLADKAFALSVVATLVARHALPLWAVPALLAREIVEAPLLAWIVATGRHHDVEPEGVTANVPGKVATVAQFVAVLAAIAIRPALPALLAVAAAAGLVAGGAYVRRALSRPTAPPPL